MLNLSSMNYIEDHVKAVFEYAHETKRPVVIKNTGHDWKGRSSGVDSIALWTHHLRHPNVPIVLDTTFIPDGCPDSLLQREKVFHFGPGETWAGAYQFAEDHGYSVLGGTCGTVGVAGWLLGGGHSPLTPKYGMGVDNVRQVELIVPNGTKVIANRCQNQDLFFAVRGGGGGTFGVLTNITYKALPKFSLQV